MSAHNSQDPTLWPPGTVIIEDQNDSNRIVLNPLPSNDPNDPLNWSKPRKTINFSLVCLYTLSTFVLLDIGTVIWAPVNLELGITYPNFQNSFAANTAGLSLGCIILVPLAIKYGRRPIYIFSAAVQFATAIWQAKVQTTWELIAVNAICGVAGAVSEAIVQMTVADLFFVHQRGTMNAVYLGWVFVGAGLAPVAAGYVAVAQGWRWIWWWTAVLLGMSFVGFVLFFEESKYVTDISTGNGPASASDEGVVISGKEEKTKGIFLSPSHSNSPSPETQSIPKKSYRTRLSLLTKTNTPLLPRMYQPFIILTTFPAATFTALQYGSLLAWFSIISTSQSIYMPAPPYNFDASGIGLFNLPPFIGAIIGSIVGGPVNDWYIVKRARGNGCVFEPEMRLHLALPAVLTCPAGILLFGLGLANGKPWIVLAIGGALFGFTFGCLGDISLTYLTDCYRDIIGDAFVGVAFIRNGLATIIVFALTPWIKTLGLYNMFVSAACLSLGVGLLTIPMIIWGKKARIRTAGRYRVLAAGQPGRRDV